MGKIFLGLFVLILIITFLPESDDKMVGAEFSTMSSCLASIKKNSGQNFDKLMKDTPDRVNGFLTNGKQFDCEKKESGSKGTYYLGTYWKDK
jgi:hypothetical protein